MTDLETVVLRATVIAGKTYPDDFTVIWRGLIRALAGDPATPFNLIYDNVIPFWLIYQREPGAGGKMIKCLHAP